MTRNTNYKPPFPYFGGKSAIADKVWHALGNPANYVEPFFGSGAVLFLRPEAGSVETVNDADGFVANFWRALQFAPEAVAEHADNPVNEADLHARHLWLIGQRERLTDRLCGDAEFYDAKAAGWWCWGLCCWIGGGWCSGNGPWQTLDGEMTLGASGKGINRTRPHLGDGKGVNRTLPHLGASGQGVKRTLPHLGASRQGVKRKMPHLGSAGSGVNRKRPHLGDAGKASPLLGYLSAFAARLRNVRVCCGDWTRVCGPSVTFCHGPTGVFLDPPYADTALRTADLYAIDCEQVAHAVREWAIEQGANPLMRIVLAGYDGEHVMPGDWRVIEWETRGGYGNAGGENSIGRMNKNRERLWCSPHCNDVAERKLFV